MTLLQNQQIAIQRDQQMTIRHLSGLSFALQARVDQPHTSGSFNPRVTLRGHLYLLHELAPDERDRLGTARRQRHQISGRWIRDECEALSWLKEAVGDPAHPAGTLEVDAAIGMPAQTLLAVKNDGVPLDWAISFHGGPVAHPSW